MKEMIFRTSDDGLVMNNASEIELVRCKDCKHGKIHGIDVECVAHEEVSYDPEPWHPLDWFCADGERMNKCCGNCEIYDREEQECVYLQVKREEDSEACDNWEEHS